MDDLGLGVRLLVLLGAVNAAPIVAKRLLGARWAVPLDGGLHFVDGRRLL
ncbi:MAG: CDP-archaeol synthase, partial [Rubrivivax sp.]|nr:CDP-archaeol synthase [Rubrivivax sp.]